MNITTFKPNGRGLTRLIRAFGCSVAGFRSALKYETAFQVGMIFLLQAALAGAAIKEEYIYVERTGDQVSTFIWTLSVSDQAEITSVSEQETFYNLCDLRGNTRLWKLDNGRVKVKARRQDNIIIIKGEKDGEPVEKHIEIDSSPWFQPLSYSLQDLALNESETIVFWMIRPDTLKVVRLQAKRADEETLVLGDQEITAIRVEITLTGILSTIWKGNYWFRKEDGLFLRYQSRHGLPGTAETVISLKIDTTSHY
jgi:hypothetical protein